MLLMSFDNGKGQLPFINWAVKITEKVVIAHISKSAFNNDGNFEHFIDVMIGFCYVEMGLRR